MKLSIRQRHLDDSALPVDHVERRVRVALAKFGETVAAVHCTLDDINGPRGGVDKLCRLRIWPRQGRELVVVEMAEDLERAVDLAAERAARRVARRLARTRQANTSDRAAARMATTAG
ncbi:MAG: HPF/RaiA family ribosome-associated protein [Myxococcota bacterium]|nr:HPF/RaiA family ribosome-associated protein [Myxococcota bacterium]